MKQGTFHRAKQLGLGVSLFASIGTGALLYYLFETERGVHRRKAISKSVHDLGERAGHLGNHFQDRVGSLLKDRAGNLVDHVSHLADHAQDAVDSLRDAMHTKARAGVAAAVRVKKSVEQPVRDHYREVPVAGYTATALSALAVGAAAVLLTDADHRNKVFNIAAETIHRAGKSFRYVGKAIRSNFEELTKCTRQDQEDISHSEAPRMPQSPNGPAVPRDVPMPTPL